MKLVKIIWIDAVTQDAWTDLNEAEKLQPVEITTIGWLLFQDDKRIVVAASFDKENEAVASVWSIPSNWLVEVVDA